MPHVFSRTEIRSLLQMALRRNHAPNVTIAHESFRMVLLFLYATGAQLREVIRLRHCDINLFHGTVEFNAATSSARKLPLGPELVFCLQNYMNKYPAIHETALLIARRGGQILVVDSVRRLFLRLLNLTGIRRRDVRDGWQPRLIDLRVTFAVHRIGQAIEKGEELNRILPALALYMGYKSLLSAEKFLHLTPERFACALQSLSPDEGPEPLAEGQSDTWTVNVRV